MVFSNILPMACVSFLYMVVWLASPIFFRCFLGSKLLDMACLYFSMSSSVVRQPSSWRM